MTVVWDDLVEAALLGTDRRPYSGDGIGDPLGPVLPGPADLAAVASAAWAWREVGRVPVRASNRAPMRGSIRASIRGSIRGEASAGSPAAAAARPDDRPLLPAGPVRSLRAILAAPHLRPLLGEWLQMAAADGRRLPPELLPDLLAVTSPDQRPALQQVAGPRLAWLAGMRPDWSAGEPAPAARRLAEAELTGKEPQWDGRDEDRVDAFRLVRATDPDAARSLAERIWASEPGSTRAALVTAFAAGLAGADEPFLEARLDERRKDTRLAAAGLLARLPGSRYAGRMAARATAAVRRAGTRLDFRLPAEPDEAARRDGVTAGASSPDEWLTQVVGAATLAAWPDPDRLVAAAVRAGGGSGGGSGSGARGLIAAWSDAAERQRDRRWAVRLLAAGAPPTPGLLGLLPGRDADDFIVDWVEHAGLGPAIGVLSDLPAWSGRVTETVMDALARLVATGDRSAAVAAVRTALPTMARRADPTRLAAVTRPAAVLDSLPDGERAAAHLYWGQGIAGLSAVVHFRHAMGQEFEAE